MGLILKSLIITFVIELITIILRFGFGLRSHNYKKHYIKYTKIRIHHMYFGIIICLINLFLYKELLFAFGIALILSDAIHHCLLKLVTNDFDFD